MLKANEPFMSRLMGLYPDCDDPGEVAYLFVRGEAQRPVCAQCGGRVNWFKNRFAETCSKACSNKRNGNAAKMRSTLMATHGVDNASAIPEVIEKRRATLFDKYGALVSENHISRNVETWERLNTKGRETFLERYGVTNPGMLPEHREKVQKTLQTRYGVSHPAQIPNQIDIREQRRYARLESKLPEGSKLLQIISPVSDNGEANYRYTLKCECGETCTLPSETFKFRMRETGTFCASCTGITTSRSIKEKDLLASIRSFYDGAIIENDRKIIAPYELDIVIPDKRIAIEFAGLFWHSEDRVGKTYHLDKMKRCRDKGYRLITVFEDEWEIRKEIVISRLKHNIGVLSNKIYARKCRVKPIDTALAKSFCEHHHIQGYAISSIKLGLFHDDQLVAVMTFARPSLAKGHRKSRETEWELSRFCVAGSVIGAANKLFKAFVAQYQPSRVITYSDLRWNTGQVYGTMGFSYSHTSRPNYWYFKGVRRIHRFKLRKTASDDPHKTEMQIRSDEGWRRIWDCGNDLWIWTPSN